MNPGIIKEKLQPNKVFAGELSSEATVCALTAVVNHDIKFSTDFIGLSIHPHNVRPHLERYLNAFIIEWKANP